MSMETTGSGQRWLAAGALCCALAVAGGAFGAHALSGRLDAHSLALWETAARYLMYSGLGQLACALAAMVQPSRGFTAAALALLAGGALFSITVGALALGGPRWLGAVTPLGGTLVIAGFLLLGGTALARR